MIRPLQALLVFSLVGLTNPVFFPAVGAEDELRFAGIFSDHAVLQRDRPIPVWGFAAPGTGVTLTFSGQEKSATAGPDGRWHAVFDPLPASPEPETMTAVAGGGTIAIHDLLVGEVWLCSGQSNMAMIVDRARDPEREKRDAGLPGLRVFKVDRKAAPEPESDVSGDWVVSSPETAGRFSATAFFFGREIHREVDVPVGLIVSAWSGSAIEAWTSREAQEKEAALDGLLESWSRRDAAHTPAIAAREQADYEKELAEWRPLRDAAAREGREKPRPPRRPIPPTRHHHHPWVLFNGMIAPLIPYGIRGAIWYQGETNGLTAESAALYGIQLPLLVKDWRRRWGQGDFPMAWVQLPPVSAERVAWAPVREAMRRASKDLPHTGMAITMDLGEARRLHPLDKQAFAHRLALWARAEVYGETGLAWSGPLPESFRAGDGRVEVTFEHAGGGLRARDGKTPAGFEIREENGPWQAAEARIEGKVVAVSNAAVGKPVAIRYAWGNDPGGNLVNGAGLPASPFQLPGEISEPPSSAVSGNGAAAARKKSVTPPPVKPPLEPVEIGDLPEGMERLDLYLLLGQSNMKGRGVMPAEPLRDPRLVMMHKKTDTWFLARHPLHLVGDPATFRGHDNAGVGPGLSFAKTMADQQPGVRIGLIPCAVGGTPIRSWQPGAKLYEDAVRRARLAVKQGPEGRTRIAGAIWLQGEADSKPERVPVYAEALNALVDGLRNDLGLPNLPFITCTILELRADVALRKSINEILLGLPDRRPRTGGVDARDLTGHIGDQVHIDTPGQNEIGRRFARKMMAIQAAEAPEK